MAKQQFTVTGPQPAYGERPGGTVTLDPDDPLVQANIENGVITAGKTSDADQAPVRVACQACTDEGKSRPPKFDTPEELTAHYAEKHPALVPPPFTAEKE